jgi:nucleoside-diphosphate-sugar epimerase
MGRCNDFWSTSRESPTLTTYCVLVAGVAGFLGTHLCDALLAQVHQIVGVDNFATGRVSNLTTLINEPRFTLIEEDIRQPFDLGRDRLPVQFRLPGEIDDRNFHAVKPVASGSGAPRKAFVAYFRTVDGIILPHNSVYAP